MTETFVIAEAGVNHNANLDLAYKLIDVAVAAGANAVKFQTAIPELVATSYAEKATYQKLATKVEESQLEMIRGMHFPLDKFYLLKEYCEKKDIIFFSTAFDLVSLAFLEKLGQKYHKVPSGEITNLPYLRSMGQFGKPVILSTGMATMNEISAAMKVLEDAGTPRKLITVLHCNTEYPTHFKNVNLRAMVTLQSAFNVQVGYSDHTLGTEVAVAAAAMGATMIEKHFTLDRCLPGPDHKASLEPKELKEMVNSIRNIEKAMGNGIKIPSPGELKNIPIARKSLVAACAITKGEVFNKENLIVKRPGTGISPMLWDEVLGCKAPRNFSPDELIEL